MLSSEKVPYASFRRGSGDSIRCLREMTQGSVFDRKEWIATIPATRLTKLSKNDELTSQS